MRERRWEAGVAGAQAVLDDEAAASCDARIVVDQAFVRQFEAKFAEPITAANYSLRLALELQHHPVFRIPGLRQEILQTESYGLLKPQRLPPGDQVYCLKQFKVLGLVDWDWDNVVSWYVFTLVLPQVIRHWRWSVLTVD